MRTMSGDSCVVNSAGSAAESHEPEWHRLLRSLGRSYTASLGALVLLAIVLAAVTAGWVSAHDPNLQVLEDRLLPPVWVDGGTSASMLGTDQLGRDILTRIIYGTRVSVAVGLLSVMISGVMGVGLGLIAGYYGGWLDTLTMRLADVQLAFPFVLLALSMVAVLGPGFANIVVVLGISNWMVYARLVRGQVLSVKTSVYVDAARSVGASDARIILRHVLPNVLAPLIIVATFGVATNIIMEASLSFLGFGVPRRIPSWGSMLADGRDYMGTAWWLTTFPGLATMATVLSINLIGDWMREAFDPHLRAT